MPNKIIVLAGATGRLGSLIARFLLAKPEVQLRLLVSQECVGKVAGLREHGVEIFELDLLGEWTDGQLYDAMRGALAVVSAVTGPDAMLEGQFRLLEAARRARVRRFIPSYFSFDISGLSEGENTNTDVLKSFERAANQVRGDVELVHIQIGCFADQMILFGFHGAFYSKAGQVFLWGDGDAKMDFTTYRDAARFAAEVAVDDDIVPSTIQFAGESLTFHELVKAYEDGSGKAVTVKKMGTLVDLKNEIRIRQQADPENIFAWLPLMHWHAMLSGRVKLHSISNDRYPNINPMTVRDYVRAEKL